MSNYYRVNSEDDLDEIINKNEFRLVMIFFSAKKPPLIPINVDIYIKKLLKHELSKKYNDNIFIYVDLLDYKLRSTDKYVNRVTKNELPYVEFYYNKRLIGNITNINKDIEKLFDTLDKLNNSILEKVFSNHKVSVEETKNIINSNSNSESNKNIIKDNNMNEDYEKELSKRMEKINELKKKAILEEYEHLCKIKKNEENIN